MRDENTEADSKYRQEDVGDVNDDPAEQLNWLRKYIFANRTLMRPEVVAGLMQKVVYTRVMLLKAGASGDKEIELDELQRQIAGITEG